MGLENYCNEIIKLLRKIDDPKLRVQKASTVISYILDRTMDSNIAILGILEMSKIALLSDSILNIGLDKIALREAKQNE